MYRFLFEFAGTLAVVYVLLATRNEFAVGAVYVLCLLVGSNAGSSTETRFGSGGLNPAATLAFAVAGSIPASDFVPLIAAQILGGLTAVELFRHYAL